MVVALTIGRKAQTTAGTSPLAELLANLHVLAEPDHHPEARAWAERRHRQLTERLRLELYRFAPLWARHRLRLLYPLSHTLDRPLDAELHDLTLLSDDLFVPSAADAILGRWAHFTSATEVTGSRSWVRECESRSFNRGDLAHLLAADPSRFRHDLLAVLDEAGSFLRSDLDRVGPALDASARTVQRRLATEDAPTVLVSLSGMASHGWSKDTVYFDKLQTAHVAVGEAGLVLVPSVLGWPHVIVKTDPGLPTVVHYLVQEQTSGPRVETQAELRQRLVILAEPGRWELCRHLINETITTTELARRTRTSKPAVSRHLRLMREAGLVVSHKEGRQVFHRLHPSLIENLGREVLRAIIR